MRIWFVSIFEVTLKDDNQNTRFNSMIREASARSHQVTYWASTFRHNVKQQRFKERKDFQLGENLRMIYLPSKSYTKNVSFQRLYSHYRFAKDLVKAFNGMQELPDLIVVAFPPISIASQVIKWANKQKVPVIIDVIDPWPDVFEAHAKNLPRFISALLFYPFRTRVREIISKASAVISISNQYLKWARSYHPSLSNTACFYPSIDYELIKQQLKKVSESVTPDKEKFTVIYAGSLGHSYDIPTILAAAEFIYKKHGSIIQFVIAGDGPQKELVQAYEKKYSNLRYTGRLTKEQLMQEYYLADLGMTQHISSATQSVTYKLFDLLACGLPILNSLESEMKEIILTHRVGLHNTPGNSEQLAENIYYCYSNPDLMEEMRKNAHALVLSEGDSNKVYKQAIDFIESIAQKK